MSEKDNQHNIIVKIKELAQQLGRVPTLIEYVNAGHSKTLVYKHFGMWAKALDAAGFNEHMHKLNRSIDSSIFEKSLENHFEEHKPEIDPVKLPEMTIASISDIHWPFDNPKVVNRFIEYLGDEKPGLVVVNGDAWDMYSHGKFPRSHNVFTPREEQATARAKNEEFWVRVKKASPKSSCYQMLGNHDIRPMKRILETYPEAEDWIKEKLKELFTYQGVTTIFDPRQELLVGQTAILHGYRTKLGDHRDYMLMNSINGHSHVGGVVFKKIKGTVLFELNSGLAGDPTAKGLTYTPQKITHWTPGFGVVNKYGPQFIPVD